MDNVQELNAKLCEVLGLDATKIASLKIELNPNIFPIVTIEMVPSDSQVLAIGQLVEVHYSLDEKKPEIILTGNDTIESVTKQAHDKGLVPAGSGD